VEVAADGREVEVLQEFAFAFDPRYRAPLAVLGVRPQTATVVAGRDVLRVRFGPWFLDTTLDNVADVVVDGPYRPYRVIGPHLSLADRGVTFGTNADAGVCVSFHEPVGALAGRRRLQHPNLTVTVVDPAGLAQLLRVRADLST
jgi:hypothetical protein